MAETVVCLAGDSGGEDAEATGQQPDHLTGRKRLVLSGPVAEEVEILSSDDEVTVESGGVGRKRSALIDPPAPEEVEILSSDEEATAEGGGVDAIAVKVASVERGVVAPMRTVLAKFAADILALQKKKAPKAKAGVKGRADDNWAKGTGFGGATQMTVENKAKTAAEKAADATQTKADLALSACCAELTRLVANTPAASGLTGDLGGGDDDARVRGAVFAPVLDCLVEAEDGALLDGLGALLRSDSLVDAERRAAVFGSALGLVAEVAQLPHLTLFLITPIDREERSSSSTAASASSSTSTPPTTLSSLLDRLDKQASTLLALHAPCTSAAGAAEATPKAKKAKAAALASLLPAWAGGDYGGGGDGMDVGAGALCRRLCAVAAVAKRGVEAARASGVLTPALLRARRRLKAAHPELFSDADVLVLGDAARVSGEAYVAALRPLRFEAVGLVDLVRSGACSHAFSAAALAGSGGGGAGPQVVGSARKRLTRLASEVASLQSNLPVEVGSAIFVRCDEERVDLLKALIIGPEGSPYENGCFEFDIWLPLDYPDSPPKVQLITTGRGAVRFNPNLYNCGKVCLSLLGTWAGPGWDPVRSTLLQVLVSIQSLIMVSNPFFNEPGFQSNMGSPLGEKYSAEYNATVREATLRHAMGDALSSPSPVFRQVVDKHFRLKGAAVQEQLRRWTAEATPGYKAIPGEGSGCAGTQVSTLAAADRVRSLLPGGGAAGPTGGGTNKRPLACY